MLICKLSLLKLVAVYTLFLYTLLCHSDRENAQRVRDRRYRSSECAMAVESAALADCRVTHPICVALKELQKGMALAHSLRYGHRPATADTFSSL